MAGIILLTKHSCTSIIVQMSSRFLSKLALILLNIKTKREMENFLAGLLTEKEIEELGRRVEIVKMLKLGVSQHEIASKLGVGVATVTRGSKEIQEGNFTSI